MDERTDLTGAGAGTGPGPIDTNTVVTVSGGDASVDASRSRSVSPREWERRVLAAGRVLHAGRVELLTALVPFDRDGRWAFSGARTCAHWIADRLGVHVGTAREWLRVAHALAVLPVVADAFAAGRLSYATVRTLTRVAVDHPDRERELLDLVADVAVSDVGRALADWCNPHEDPDPRDRRRKEQTRLRVRVEPDGMATLTLRAPALDVGRVHAAVDARVMQGIRWDDGGFPPLGAQRALALIDVCTAGGATVDTEVIVHVRADGCTLHDGTPLADHAVAGLVDTAFIRALIHDTDGRPIDATGRRRHPSTRQARVVDERVPVCVDCGTRDLLEYDHDPDYAVTRRTVIDELTRRCAPCHRRRHRLQDDR